MGVSFRIVMFPINEKNELKIREHIKSGVHKAQNKWHHYQITGICPGLTHDEQQQMASPELFLATSYKERHLTKKAWAD
eukprot:11551260-Ditylum_brightwellii.AAC.1